MHYYIYHIGVEPADTQILIQTITEFTSLSNLIWWEDQVCWNGDR